MKKYNIFHSDSDQEQTSENLAQESMQTVVKGLVKKTHWGEDILKGNKSAKGVAWSLFKKTSAFKVLVIFGVLLVLIIILLVVLIALK